MDQPDTRYIKTNDGLAWPLVVFMDELLNIVPAPERHIHGDGSLNATLIEQAARDRPSSETTRLAACLIMEAWGTSTALFRLYGKADLNNRDRLATALHRFADAIEEETRDLRTPPDKRGKPRDPGRLYAHHQNEDGLPHLAFYVNENDEALSFIWDFEQPVVQVSQGGYGEPVFATIPGPFVPGTRWAVSNLPVVFERHCRAYVDMLMDAHRRLTEGRMSYQPIGVIHLDKEKKQ